MTESFGVSKNRLSGLFKLPDKNSQTFDFMQHVG